MLLPLLKQTAASASSLRDSARVIWTGSLAIELGTPVGGMDLDDLGYEKGGSQMYFYSQSKCGNLFLGSELARRSAGEGIISVVLLTHRLCH
jgi:retinol dehydrogenase-12